MGLDDDVKRWAPEQEQWRGRVDADISAFRDRLRDIAQSREDQGRDVSRRFSEAYAKMTDIEKDADSQRQRLEDKIDRLDKKISDSETAVLHRIARSEAKLTTLWVIGGGGFVVIIALVQWLLGGSK